jgi:hypothetical protein
MNLATNTARMINLRNGQEFGAVTQLLVTHDAAGRIHYGSADNRLPAGKLTRAAGEPANVVDLAITRTALYALDSAGSIHSYSLTAPKGKWAKDVVAKDVVGISADHYGNVWCMNQGGEIFGSLMALGGNMPWERVTDLGAGAAQPGWTYTVLPNDGIYQIIRGHYKVTDQPTLKRIADEIVRLNQLPNENTIAAGQTLTMPALSYR